MIFNGINAAKQKWQVLLCITTEKHHLHYFRSVMLLLLLSASLLEFFKLVMEAIKLTIDCIDYFKKILSWVQYMLLQFYFISCFLFFFSFSFYWSTFISFSLMRLCRKSLLKQKHILCGAVIFCQNQHTSWIHPHSPL